MVLFTFNGYQAAPITLRLGVRSPEDRHIDVIRFVPEDPDARPLWIDDALVMEGRADKLARAAAGTLIGVDFNSLYLLHCLTPFIVRVPRVLRYPVYSF